MRRLLATALAASAFVVLAEAPAHAVAPAITDVDWTSTPGHVTGTVSSEQPWVFVDLGVGDGVEAASWVGPQGFVAIDPSTGTGTFDLETWGLRSSSGEPQTILAAASCTADSAGACDFSVLATSPWFQPTDVRPELSVAPSDGFVGPYDPVSITSSDPVGGGELRADWLGDDGRSASTALNRNGTTAVAVTEGPGRLAIRRCMSGSTVHCDDFDTPLERSLVVNRVLDASMVALGPAATPSDPWARFSVDTDAVGGVVPQHVTITHTETGETRRVYPWNVQAQTDAEGVFTFELPTVDRTPGLWTVAGQSTVDDDRFGWVPGPLHAPDGTLPTFYVEPLQDVVLDDLTVSRPYVHAGAGDAYGRVELDAHGTGGNGREEFVVRNSSGTVVRKLESNYSTGHWSASFNGRNQSGQPLRAGTYTVRLRGITGQEPQSATVRVKRLVGKTWIRTFSANSSKVDQEVGRCSTLRSPSRRTAWTGSLGYYASSRCTSTDLSATGVFSLHASAYLPPAARYNSVAVSTYGGAATSRPRSAAVQMLIRTDGTTPYADTIGPTVGWYPGAWTGASSLIHGEGRGRYVLWAAGTNGRNRFDIKSFRISVRYQVWQ